MQYKSFHHRTQILFFYSLHMHFNGDILLVIANTRFKPCIPKPDHM
ncbi:hypothetical protein CUZ56_00090 [Saezia sanguinis]|uniref:Uncharacterized protein n=1 Tax=Saezia sanguinis TaxID=1965230 RepID=A0A433SFV3_9BURK|nr:hypothetical protein CUZ56_00090 [Saezia sanguinis]